MRWKVGCALVLLLVAGCTAAPRAAPPTADPLPEAVRSEALPTCANAKLDECIESTVAIDGKGRVYVANGWGPQLARSDDGGATWTPLAGPPVPAQAAPSATDADALVRATPDGRIVYSAIYEQFVGTSFSYLGLHVAVSDDGGRDWPVNQLLSLDAGRNPLGADRQWTASGPDGSLYLAYDEIPVAAVAPEVTNPAIAVTGNHLVVARSDDGGTTWGPSVAATAPGGGAYGGDLKADAHGDLAMPAFVGPADMATCGLALLRSGDRGATWRAEALPAPGCGAGQPRGWPDYAAAPDGAEAVAWVNATGTLLVLSHAPGAAWSAPVAWTVPGEAANVPPAVQPWRGGWAVAFALEHGRPAFGDFFVAFGDGNGPRQRVALAHDVLLPGGGANGDFSTLAAGPAGALAATVTRTGALSDPAGTVTAATGGSVDAYVFRPTP